MGGPDVRAPAPGHRGRPTARSAHQAGFGLLRDGSIRYVMVDGIAHVPADAIDDYRAKAS